MLVRHLQQPFQAGRVGCTVIVQQPYPMDDVVWQRRLPSSYRGEARCCCRPETVVCLQLDKGICSQ